MSGQVVAVCVSEKKGEKKKPVSSVFLEEDHGIRGDAHAGPGTRQVSLLSVESIEKMRALGLDVGPGDFAENITVSGVDFSAVTPGAKIRIGETVVVEVTQKGKECHDRCAIFYQAGDCVMPREGVFGRVVRGGQVKPGDTVVVEEG
ncbi:MAG: MOSC domain-containing protein [Deltaproteobacteria bacterium]|nr:MAG: MOSC domain-containing protein [Deltaproteobacteria bacterium]